VISAAALGGAATYLVGGAATGAAQGAAQSAAAQPSTGSTDYFVDMLLRPGPAGQAPASPPGPAVQAGQQGNDQAVRREVGRIFVRSVRDGSDLSAPDRAYLAQLVSQRTGMSQADADKRVSDVITQAKAAADDARRSAAKTALWMTAAMIIGAFAASLAAIEGGQLRDGRWHGIIGTRSYTR